MEKTKLGLTTGVLGAITYLVFLFGGYVAGLLLLGYILLRETDDTLKVSALTGLVAVLAFSLANIVVGLLPDVFNIFESLLNIIGAYINLNFLNPFTDFLYQTLALLKSVCFVWLAAMSFLKKPVQPAYIKKLFD